jgi:hypothetical protein
MKYTAKTSSAAVILICAAECTRFLWSLTRQPAVDTLLSLTLPVSSPDAERLPMEVGFGHLCYPHVTVPDRSTHIQR